MNIVSFSINGKPRDASSHTSQLRMSADEKVFVMEGGVFRHVASRADMTLIPEDVPGESGLFRSGSIDLVFRSYDLMMLTLEAVERDLAALAAWDPEQVAGASF